MQLATTLHPEKREALERIIAEGTAIAANPPLPKTGPVFASENGTPLNRTICSIGKFCQRLIVASFRRGLGTNLKRLGVDLKTIQDILRHAHIATTADIYVKDVSEDAIAAMQLLQKRVEAELRDNSPKVGTA